ncbi:MAG: hypothetical protein K8T10_20140 [Candidatus Eremiobacteraeota bacterium]|nr:hypothetical protein [Candidatus Eremiobacteraeota bacterium]
MKWSDAGVLSRSMDEQDLPMRYRRYRTAYYGCYRVEFYKRIGSKIEDLQNIKSPAPVGSPRHSLTSAATTWR